MVYPVLACARGIQVLLFHLTGALRIYQQKLESALAADEPRQPLQPVAEGNQAGPETADPVDPVEVESAADATQDAFMQPEGAAETADAGSSSPLAAAATKARGLVPVQLEPLRITVYSV